MDAQWGRIADDGTVFVKVGDGEREIGSWQAGDAAAGFAFYERRYDDLATEVDLLEKRLESGAGDPAATHKHAEELVAQLDTAAVIGNIEALRTRLAAVVASADAKGEQFAAAKKQAREDAIAAKQKLVDEAEQIASSATSWKASGDRLRAIVDEWKQIRGVDRRTDDALWKRFAAARDAFGKRRGQHFAELDASRSEVKTAKEKLIARAQELAESDDWKETADELRTLMQQWKELGRASHSDEEKLWSRFRAAQDKFFDRRSGVFAERDAEQVGNQKQKEAIIAEAEKISLANVPAAQSALRELQARYDEIGHVPRDAMRSLDNRMRAAEQRVRDAADAEWRTGTPESNPFLAAMKDRLAEAEAKLERARKAGDAARIAKAEQEVAQRKALIPGA